MTSSWNETTLSNEKLEVISNADDFGFFYQCFPNKTHQFKRKKCFGGQKSKVRVTKMVTVGATGEKRPMFFMAK